MKASIESTIKVLSERCAKANGVEVMHFSQAVLNLSQAAALQLETKLRK